MKYLVIKLARYARSLCLKLQIIAEINKAEESGEIYLVHRFNNIILSILPIFICRLKTISKKISVGHLKKLTDLF